MIVLVMGTTGAGKTTIGKMLAERLQWRFLDADDFHPLANIKKMSAGIPLEDADRVPWLAAIHAELLKESAAGKNCVLACSALKQSYRDTLAVGIELKVVYLQGSFEELRSRIHERHGHFAGDGILAGQFRDLEEPNNALVVPVQISPQEIVDCILRELHLPA